MEMQPNENTIARRTVLRGAAWAAPVMAAAAAVPLAAATGQINIIPGENATGNHFAFSDVVPPETVPLEFEVTDGTSAYNGIATAMLVGAAGIAVWDSSVDLGNDLAWVEVQDGVLILPVDVRAHGEFTVNVMIDSVLRTFTVSV